MKYKEAVSDQLCSMLKALSDSGHDQIYSAQFGILDAHKITALFVHNAVSKE